MDKQDKHVRYPKIDNEKIPHHSLVHNLEGVNGMKKNKFYFSIASIILLGIISGFGLSAMTTAGTSGGSSTVSSGGTVTSGKAVGSTDTRTFSDSAEGELQAGGLNGEGTHKLIRPGGDSQTVYLTSSVLDLSQFEGKKVRVWGQTNAAQAAGWLMDVGKVEALN